MDLDPLIEGISKLIGAGGEVAAESVKPGEGITGKGAVRGGTAHSAADVERWLGPLSMPEKQVPLIHDYLRGHAALGEATATGAEQVRGISVPVWSKTQNYLQSQVDTDPEVQDALKTLFIGKNTPKDPDVTTVQQKAVPVEAPTVSVNAPDNAPTQPQAKAARPTPSLGAVQKKQQADAWNEFAIATESQDEPRINLALEHLRALHETQVPGKPGETPSWQKALDYMGSLEQQVQQMQAARVTNEAWSQSIEDFRKQQGIDMVPLPQPVRRVLDRFDAWADAQKPPSGIDRVAEALGAPRAVMSSADLSAPGRQGLLMISRPEYWQNLRPMLESWDEGKFLESQAYIRNHPDYPAAQDAGLALTDIHSKLAPREEAFQSQLAERLPVLGSIVKASEQAYTTFLNRLRLDVFSNSLKQAEAAGIDTSAASFQKSLAEWINTSTGRGGRGLNPGVLSTVLFSPRLAISRIQTFNPYYYYKMDPFVRGQAIKANLAAAGLVFGLVSLAGMSGARVTWDFRNPDAGKIRIGNTRLDLGGGHFQFMRLFWQIATQQKVNPDTGKVTKLGEKFGAPTGLDLVQNFIVSKEAPVASFVTDWLRGKDQSGNKFDLSQAIVTRTVPLAMQDVYGAFNDQGVQGLLYAAPALVGVGLQTYKPNAQKATVPFNGVRGQIPPEDAAAYVKAIEAADTTAATEAAAHSIGRGPVAAKAILRAYVKRERLKVRMPWIQANRDSFTQGKIMGRPTVGLTSPEAVH